MNRTQTTAALVATTVGVLALFGLAACPGTPATTLYTPITGLVIDSEALLSGIGCGTASNQVYKYAAVVTLAGDAGSLPGLPVSGVFDCFADGQFANLSTPDGNLTSYTIAIYAFNEASFPADALGECTNLESDAACQGENPATVLAHASMANWKTTCTATQVPGVSEVAVCGSLVPVGDASVAPDEGTDTSSPDAAEEGEAGSTEAGDAATPVDSAAPDGAPGDTGAADASDAGTESG